MEKKGYLRELFNLLLPSGIMPIRAKTMRDIWDRGKKRKRGVKKSKILPPEFERYELEYLIRKEDFLEMKEKMTKLFADYEKRLGEAGFSKI